MRNDSDAVLKIQEDLKTKKIKIPRALIKYIIDSFLMDIKETLIAQEEYKVHKFGTYELRTFKGKSTSTSTGINYTIDPFKYIKFIPIPKLKNSIRYKQNLLERNTNETKNINSDLA
jgi:nucleoid DNA-binding protein